MTANRKPITLEQRKQAEKDFARFFNEVDQDNPSDINTKEKYDFAYMIGWDRLRVMQSLRKNNDPVSKRDKRA